MEPTGLIDSIASTVGSWSAPAHEKYDISMYQNTDLMARLRYDDGGHGVVLGCR